MENNIDRAEAVALGTLLKMGGNIPPKNDIAKAIITTLSEAGLLKEDWINVKDRLPEKSGVYLCYDEDYRLIKSRYFDKTQNCFPSAVFTSHWQYIPPSPTKE